jgi:hypothetical protein
MIFFTCSISKQKLSLIENQLHGDPPNDGSEVVEEDRGQVVDDGVLGHFCLEVSLPGRRGGSNKPDPLQQRQSPRTC